MQFLKRVPWTYKGNGRQGFLIDVYCDGNDYVGRGLSVNESPLTGDFRVPATLEELDEAAKIDALDAVVTGVQGKIMELIDANKNKPKSS